MLFLPKINTYFAKAGDFLKLNISSSALKALNTLENAGFEAFCVGGAIRDILRGIVPEDYDIATNAIPEEVVSLFPKCIATGIKHGTVTAIVDNSAIEITTYRSDGEYADNRHPENVLFIKSIEEDLARRDFTINAIAYSPKRGIIDPFGGMADIENGIIKCVGDAEKRFSEDALRIIRCFRFAAVTGFRIDAATLRAATVLKESLSSVSRERIFAELCKMLSGSHLSLCSPLLGEGKLSEISLLPSKIPIRFFAWCIAQNRDPELTAAKLKASNNFIKALNNIRDCTYFDHTDTLELKLRYAKFGEEILKDGLNIKENILGQDISAALKQIKTFGLLNLPKSLADLNISGQDIASLGLSGSEIGDMLQRLYIETIKYPNLNTREALIDIAKKFL